MTTQVPYVSYLELGVQPHLVAAECTTCGARFLDRRNACARCGGVDFTSTPLATTGTVRAFTIVHRATPDVAVPYISVVVDLDGGGVVKSHLVGVSPSPEQVPLGGRVELTTTVVATDVDGTEAVTFAFTPTATQTDAADDQKLVMTT